MMLHFFYATRTPQHCLPHFLRQHFIYANASSHYFFHYMHKAQAKKNPQQRVCASFMLKFIISHKPHFFYAHCMFRLTCYYSCQTRPNKSTERKSNTVVQKKKLFYPNLANNAAKTCKYVEAKKTFTATNMKKSGFWYSNICSLTD